MTQPQSVRRFELLYLLSVAASILGTFQTWDDTLDMFRQSAGVQLDPLILVGILAVLYGISLLLWYLAARRRSNIARWILLVLMLISLIGLPAFFLGSFDIIKALGLASTALSVAAVIMLFRPDARPWFTREEAEMLVVKDRFDKEV